MDDKILDIGTILKIDWDNPINNGKSAFSERIMIVNRVYVSEKSHYLYQIAWYHHQTPFDSDLSSQMLSYLDVKPYTIKELLSWLKVIDVAIFPVHKED
jgi:hypothetical protein